MLRRYGGRWGNLTKDHKTNLGVLFPHRIKNSTLTEPTPVDNKLYLQWDGRKRRYVGFSDKDNNSGSNDPFTVNNTRRGLTHNRVLYTNLEEETTAHWLRLYDQKLKDRQFDRAWNLLKRMSLNYLTKDLIISALSGFIYEVTRTTTPDIDLAIKYLDQFPIDFKEAGFDSPPARCVAYILHYACNLEDVIKSHSIISDQTRKWKKFGKSIESVFMHEDILYEQEREYVSSVMENGPDMNDGGSSMLSLRTSRIDGYEFNDCNDIIEKPVMGIREIFGDEKYKESLDDEGNINYMRLYDSLNTEAERMRFEREYDYFNQRRQREIEVMGFSLKVEQLEETLMHNISKRKTALHVWEWSESLKNHFSGADILRQDKVLKRYKEILEKVGNSKISTIVALEMINSLLRNRVTSKKKNEVSVAMSKVPNLAIRIASAIEEIYLSRLTSDYGKSMKRKQQEDFSGASLRAGYTQTYWNVANAHRWSHHDRISIGTSLVALALDLFKIGVKNPETGVIEQRPAFWHSYTIHNGNFIGVIKANDYLQKELGQDAPLFMIGVSKKLPMLVKPRPRTSFDEGGHLYFSLPLLSSTAFQSPDQEAYVKAAVRTDRMDEVMEALDRLSACQWAVNSKVLSVIEAIWDSGEETLGVPVRPREYDHEWEKRNLSKQERRRLKEQRNEREVFNMALQVAKTFGKHGERFYYPYQVDFRGRVYPATSTGFVHVNQDAIRAMLQFWYGKKLGIRGLRWLKIHLANMYGMDKVSNDDRVEFVNSHMKQVIASADSPLDSQWWKTGDKPFQTLAACFEIAEAMKLGTPENYISRIPVNQDGSCNGLQHYAALGGDVEGAKQVNMVENQPTPQDIYGEVSKIVTGLIKQDYEETGNEIAEVLQDKISRKVVKQPVMTSVYGVTQFGVIDQVCAQLEKIEQQTNLDPDKRMDYAQYIATKILLAQQQLFGGATKLQNWLEECTNRICQSFRFDMSSHHHRRNDLFKHSYTTMIWTTPLGFPVVQPYRDAQTMFISTKLQSVALMNPFEVAPVKLSRQRNGIAPNFIHSLDSTHLFMTVNRCHRHITFASVHDSFWTHACDVDILSQNLRESFAELYNNRKRQHIIEDLYNEFQSRYSGHLQLVEISRKNHGPVYEAIKSYRMKNVTNNKKFADLNKRPSLQDHLYYEMELEYNRWKNPDGNIIETPSTILESYNNNDKANGGFSPIFDGKAYNTTPTTREEDHHTNNNQQATAAATTKDNIIKILVPIHIPPPPPKGTYSTKQVLNSEYFFS